MRTRQLAAVLSGLVAFVSAYGQTPLGQAFTYQGQLKLGGVAHNGIVDLRFRLYDAEMGGSQAGPTVCTDDVTVTEGLFTVALDFGAQFTGQERFLEVDVRADTGQGCGFGFGFDTLTSRQALTATPHALFALNADLLGGLQASDFLQSIPVPLTLSGSNSSHIIRGENSSAAIPSAGVVGASTAATGITFGVMGQSASTSGRGVLGLATAASGTTYGVWGESESTTGRGVYGQVLAATGDTNGGRFQSASSSGVGAFGRSTASTGMNYGVRGESESTSGCGVMGYALARLGSTTGVRGRSDSDEGIGVFGEAESLSGTTHGGWFESASPAGIGVSGLASSATGENYGGYFEARGATGVGVLGQASSVAAGTTYGGRFVGSGIDSFGLEAIGGAYGVNARATRPNGVGVFGAVAHASGNGFGGWFESASSSGVGAMGWARAETGIAYGGYFQSDSTSGRAVMGVAFAGEGTATAGRFENASPDGTAVFGWAHSEDIGGAYGGHFESRASFGKGVYALATGDYSTGVYGSTTVFSSGYGVYSGGDLGAFGVKSFRIDHPDDPENKFLLHYSTESPEVINFYSGKVTLDAAGEAVVELPHYFARINRDPRYMLTAIGAPMPALHVAQEIDDAALTAGARAEPAEVAAICSFRIAGGAPRAKVSWRVEAVRNDRWVQRRGAAVEVEKPAPARGTYQVPELYGQPAERGEHYDRNGGRPSPPVSRAHEGSQDQ